MAAGRGGWEGGEEKKKKKRVAGWRDGRGKKESEFLNIPSPSLPYPPPLPALVSRKKSNPYSTAPLSLPATAGRFDVGWGRKKKEGGGRGRDRKEKKRKMGVRKERRKSRDVWGKEGEEKKKKSRDVCVGDKGARNEGSEEGKG